MFKKTKKILLALLVALEIFLISYSPAHALFGIPKMPSATSIAKQLEKRYHLNLESMQNAGESFNIADKKNRAPEVMLFFSPSDPKIGEKITAKAVPLYFLNPTESLYYTWYLKHAECDLNKNPSDRIKDLCDKDNDNKITVEDWKIEAMRIIANNGFRWEEKADYNHESDSDGYRSSLGGDRDRMPDHCYIHDFGGGINYEIVDGTLSSNGTNFYAGGSPCPSDKIVCVEDTSVTCSDGSSSTDYNICSNIGMTPDCDANDCWDESIGDWRCRVNCPSGSSPYCIDESSLDPDCGEISANQPCSSLGTSITYCTTSDLASNNFNEVKWCDHIFPNGINLDTDKEYITGDNNFPRGEEKFWRTNPADPDTADNGNMDEANVTGLGIIEFEWNYMTGDKVGVAVEGNSTIPTKYDDTSMMIMWALPKNKCEISNKGYYIKKIKGYDVKIPIATADIDKCLEDNLIDPREGGQPKNIDVSLSYFPENPINDSTGNYMGDEVKVQSSINNANKENNQIYYRWRVALAENGNFSLDEEDWIDITDEMIDNKEISLTEGIDIDSLTFRLNFNDQANLEEKYLQNNGQGFLRVYLEAEESFDEGVTRNGNTNVIVPFKSSEEKIVPHTVNVIENEDGTVKLDLNEPICNEDILGQANCFVPENEIVGVEIDNSNFTNFSWKLNGKIMLCDKSISDKCEDNKQTSVTFFPITGNPGETYTITLTANEISSNNSVSFTRNFQIASASVKIYADDTNNVWPRAIGSYYDLNGEEFIDYSDKVYESNSGNAIVLNASVLPTSSDLKIKWFLDGLEQLDYNDSSSFDFIAEKPSGSAYNVSISAQYLPSNLIRKALKQIWGVSQFTSTETSASDSIQILLKENKQLTSDNQSDHFLASILGNTPAQILFMLKIILTVFAIILTSGLIFSFYPENRKNTTV